MIAELPSVLADKNATKLNFKDKSKDSTLPADWQSIERQPRLFQQILASFAYKFLPITNRKMLVFK